MKIENPGKYIGMLTSAAIQRTPHEEDALAFCVNLYAESEDGYELSNRLYFSHREIQSGRNTGMSFAAKASATLAELGVRDGSLRYLQEAIASGIKAEFVYGWGEFKGERTLECKYINPVRNEIPLEKVDIDALLKEFVGAGESAVPPSAEASAATVPQAPVPDAGAKQGDDEIPF